MPNLIKLYAASGPLWVNINDWHNGRTLMPIYTSRGNRLVDTKEGERRMKTGECCSVHKDNLFASLDLAIANRERILADIYGRNAA